ncbi:MAG: hypothetical protein K8I00_03385 [Candidatus Omnitrophica bacterium]|nr:hypothetical protein [Candidatus Omnitrophota bacterium]
MFKKILVLCILIGSLSIHQAWARPPSKITAQYDAKNRVLMLDIYHLSRNNIKEYVKRVEVQKNDERPIIKTPRQQVNPNVQYVDIALKAAEGDKITILAESSLGGEIETELEITAELLEKAITPRATMRRAAATRPADKDRIKAAVPGADSDVVQPAVPRDPDKYSSPHPTEASKLRPAVPRDSNVSKPAVNPAVSTSTHPKDASKYKPAVPKYQP